MATLQRFLARYGLDSNNISITNVADPVGAQDAATRNFASNASNLTAGTLVAARLPAFTGGDATSSAGSALLTLANTAVTPNPYGTASSVGTFTVDSKGRITLASNLAILLAQSQVTNLVSDLALKADLISPTFTGTPLAPTASSGTNTSQIATTAFVTTAVDAARQGLTVKNSVRAGTTASITLSAPQTIDGVSVIAGDRVLVKDQSTASGNGIYVVAAGAWTRATDFDAASDVLTGAFTFITEGTVNADSGWVMTTDGTITLGTTSLAFTQFSGAGSITAGAGLTKTGPSIDVGTASSARIVVNPDSIDLATTGVGASTYNSVTVDSYGRVTAGTNPTTLAGHGIVDAQPLDGDLTAIAALAGTSGLARKTAVDTWTLDTSTYLTTHPTISGAGTISNSGITYIQSLTFDTNGHVTAQTSSAIRSASTSQTGIVQLNDTVNSTSTTLAATTNSVKTAYDLAFGAVSATGNVLPLTQGQFSSAVFVTSTTTANQVALSLSAATFRTIKATVQAASGSAYASTELLCVHNGTTVFLTEYATVLTGAALATFDVDISGGNIRLLVTPVNAVTTFKLLFEAINV